MSPSPLQDDLAVSLTKDRKHMSFVLIDRKEKKSSLSISSLPIPVAIDIPRVATSKASNKFGASSSLLRKYDIEYLLGEGSTGVVVRGERIEDKMPVAIKFIHKVRCSKSK